MKDDTQHLKAIELAENYLNERLAYRRALSWGAAIWALVMVVCPVAGFLVEDVSGFLRLAGTFGFIGIMLFFLTLSFKGLPGVGFARKQLAQYREDHLQFLMS